MLRSKIIAAMNLQFQSSSILEHNISQQSTPKEHILGDGSLVDTGHATGLKG